MKLQSPFSDTFSQTPIPSLTVSPDFAGSITERSIGMQADFNYWGKDQAPGKNNDSTSFYGQPDESYLLDDYTRFPVMEEVLREYVAGIRVRNKNNNFSFQIPNKINNRILDGSPLVLLDGVPVFSANQLMSIDPLKVKEIEVVARKYYLNGISTDGIASFRTYTGDMAGYKPDSKALVLDYDGILLKKEFYTPRYDSPAQTESRKPDKRVLLLWAPDISVSGNQKKIVEFYTSDVKGVFQIIVQGLTESGNPVSFVTEFKVE